MGASMRALDADIPKVRCKDFLSILDFNHEELAQAIALATRLKRERSLGLRAPTSHPLDGRHIGLLFEKPSLRTRVTFTIGVRELGGDMRRAYDQTSLTGTGVRHPVGWSARGGRST